MRAEISRGADLIPALESKALSLQACLLSGSHRDEQSRGFGVVILM